MRKLIHSNFELDLSLFKLSDTEENSWFSDMFFTKFSFPFEIDLTEDLDIAFDFISLYTTKPTTYFELMYNHNNIVEKAIFEIEKFQDKLSCTLRFGLEQLPSFDKKLSELPLDNFDLPNGVTIYEHAESVINQTWPAVNYNFPMIHTDKYDTGVFPFNSFQKIINLRKSGVFLENELVYDAEINEYVEINRNIIQPLPYFLHVLNKGFEADGYELAGNVLENVLLQNSVIFADVDYYKKLETAVLEFYKLSEDTIGAVDSSYIAILPNTSTYPDPIPVRQHSMTKVLPLPGRYRVVGTITIMGLLMQHSKVWINYYPTGQEIFYVEGTDGFGTDWFGPIKKVVDVDFFFDTTDTNVQHSVSVQSYQHLSADEVIFDLNFTRTNSYEDGVIVTNIYNDNKINLKSAVPDIYFTDLLKFLKNYLNYDFTKIEGNKIYMDLITERITDNDAIDLSDFEKKKPLRSFNQGKSFLLRFEDYENQKYKFSPVYHSGSSVLYDNYKTDDNTSEILINGLPLPELSRDGILTAHSFEQNSSKIYLVNYSGLTNGKNVSGSSANYLLPAVHLSYWKQWFDFRIQSQSFQWVFKTYFERINKLTAKSKIYAYKKYHLIKSITKTEISPEEFEVEIETESIP